MSWSEADIPSQKGRLVIITGTGGLGFETARALAQKGADVIVAGRNAAKGADAIAQLRALAPGAEIRFEQVDLASLRSIKSFADRMIAADRPIDILINNAGVMGFPKRRESEDGFELQMGTNHIGHFALTLRLLPLLLRTPAPRVVSLSSSTHKMAKLDLDDLQSQRVYNPNTVYGNTKLATLMFAMELDRRAKAAGLPLVSTAAHPGIAQTELMSNGPTGRPVLQFLSHLIERLVGQSPAGGALPTLRAATDPQVKGGEYFGPSGKFEIKGPPITVGLSEAARNEANRKRLWDMTEQLTGLTLADAVR